MSYAITDIIRWAKISQPLATRDQSRKESTVTGSTIIDLDVKLYIERKSLEYAYAQDPTSDETFQIGQWVLALIGIYLFEAQETTGSGGTISPVSPSGPTINNLFPLVKVGSDFESDAVSYNNPDIVGFNLMLWVSNYSQEWQFAPGFFIYTSTGFKIVAADFNINDYDRIIIDDFNSVSPVFTPSGSQLPTVINYDLSANNTLITNPTGITTDGQQVIIVIKPNGFTYTWDTNFEFSDTEPETPSPIGVNTLQEYTFDYLVSAGKLVASSQSLNIPI